MSNITSLPSFEEITGIQEQTGSAYDTADAPASTETIKDDQIEMSTPNSANRDHVNLKAGKDDGTMIAKRGTNPSLNTQIYTETEQDAIDKKSYFRKSDDTTRERTSRNIGGYSSTLAAGQKIQIHRMTDKSLRITIRNIGANPLLVGSNSNLAQESSFSTLFGAAGGSGINGGIVPAPGELAQFETSDDLWITSVSGTNFQVCFEKARL